jgi:hypothetical protein
LFPVSYSEDRIIQIILVNIVASAKEKQWTHSFCWSPKFLRHPYRDMHCSFLLFSKHVTGSIRT